MNADSDWDGECWADVGIGGYLECPHPCCAKENAEHKQNLQAWKLKEMKPIAFDTETWRFQPGLQAPKLVCGAFTDGTDAQVMMADAAARELAKLAEDPEALLIGHNVGFDMIVAMEHEEALKQSVFAAYRDGRVSDTMIREKVIRLGHGELDFHWDGGPKPSATRYRLSDLVYRYLKLDISADKTGTDVWRTRYAELDGLPQDQWPEEAIAYVLADADLTHRVWRAQLSAPDGPGGPVIRDDGRALSEEIQCGAHLALMLMTTWGLRTDPERVAALKAKLTEEVEAAQTRLLEVGFMKVKNKKGEVSKNMQAIREAVTAAFDGEPPLTDKGAVSTSKDTLSKCHADEDLQLLASISGSQKLLSAFVPVLESGTQHPTNPKYSILMNTGRTSSFDFNVQQMPRLGGVRECFIPRPGYYYTAIDYDTLELRALAQTCLDVLGYSKLAEALRAGLDPHLQFGATLLGIEYDMALEMRAGKHGPENRKLIGERRQMAKAANFGYPGRLGPETFMEYARATYGVVLDLSESRDLRTAWFGQWVEMKDYFAWVDTYLAGQDTTWIPIVGTELIRGEATCSAACNTPFQGRAAMGAKVALFDVAEACYAKPESPAYGSRPCAFIHDEVLAEVPIAKASTAAKEIARLMVQGMAKVIPELPITAEPALMERWYKDAEPVWGEDGELLLWRPGA